MRSRTLKRRGSHPGTQRRPAQRTVRPRIEMLESRLVPSTIDYSMGFADHSGLTANGSAGFNGSLAVLTTGGQNQAGSIFTNSQVDITHFTADFTFTMGTGPNSGGGLAFVMQSGSPTALGTSGIGLGFSGIPKVFAVTFYIGGEPGAPPNSTGTTPGVGTVIEGMDLHSTDQFEASLSYDGTTVHDTLKDLTTGATFSHDFAPIDIVSIIGSQTAFIGFSGGTGTLTSAATIQTFLGTFGTQSTPTLTSISPTTAVEGNSDLTLTVSGSNFASNSTVQWNGTGLTTAFVNANQLAALVPANFLAEEGNASVTVSTPGVGSSAALTFTVTDAPLTGTPVSLNATAGTAFTLPVATFSDANSNPDINDFSATILWGDGNVSTGTITQNSDGSFSVSGTNTYQAAGTYSIIVLITDVGGSSTATTSTASVASPDLPLSAVGIDISATVFVAQDFTVAVFTDPDSNAQVGDYTVTIDWGDGTSTDSGRVSQPGGSGTAFLIDQTHAYNDVGTFTVHVQILDDGGAFAETFSTATVVSPQAPRSRSGGNGGPLGRNLLAGLNEVQTSARLELQGGKFTSNPSAASPTPLLFTATAQSAQAQRADDAYWQLLSRWRGDRVTDPNGWAAYQLALALEPTTV